LLASIVALNQIWATCRIRCVKPAELDVFLTVHHELTIY